MEWLLLLLLWQRSRLRSRSYLKRSSLLPADDSAWTRLHHRRDDLCFRNVMGVDVAAFDELHVQLKPWLPVDTLRCSLDSRGLLGLALHFLNSTMVQKTLCELFGLTPTVCCRLLWRTLEGMERAFANGAVPKATIAWPSSATRARWADSITSRWPGVLPRRPFAFMDGLRLRIMDPGDELEQNAYYSGKESECVIGNILVFGADGTIIWWRGNYPGSAHDMTIAAPLWDFLRFLPAPFCVLADQGFRRADIQEFVLCTRGVADLLYADLKDEEMAQAESVASARQAAEWGMRALQGTFGRLRTRLTENSTRRATLLVCCMHLHNFITRSVGVNQIKTVYQTD
jgi:hypothetical protein